LQVCSVKSDGTRTWHGLAATAAAGGVPKPTRRGTDGPASGKRPGEVGRGAARERAAPAGGQGRVLGGSDDAIAQLIAVDQGCEPMKIVRRRARQAASCCLRRIRP
jgi:hypothetical protein